MRDDLHPRKLKSARRYLLIVTVVAFAYVGLFADAAARGPVALLAVGGYGLGAGISFAAFPAYWLHFVGLGRFAPGWQLAVRLIGVLLLIAGLATFLQALSWVRAL